MNKKWITGIFILVTIALILFLIFRSNGNADEATAKCIGEKTTLYIATGCAACKYQEDLFGENYKYMNKIDCAVTSEKCHDIIGTPTWIIDGEQVRGVQSIEKLKELTGC